ncbi:MAG: DoxX family protein [Nanoarchaeota archaeon]
MLSTRHGESLYVVFRMGIGILFFLVGTMKIFGLWGMPGGPAAFGTLVWFAGMGEILIGFALVFGVLVRLASIFGIIEMIVAYIIGHALPSGTWNPIVNQGQPALLYMLAFAVLLAYGARKASFENVLWKRELF